MEDSSQNSSGLSIVTVAGAVASGLGVLGFVTLAGGVVLWSRFKAMGVAPDDAVAFVPKSDLISTGADFLVPAFLSATAIVAILMISQAVRKGRDARRKKKASGPGARPAHRAPPAHHAPFAHGAPAQEGATGACGFGPAEGDGSELRPQSLTAPAITAAVVVVLELAVVILWSDVPFWPAVALGVFALAGGFVIGLALWLPNIGTAAMGLVAFLAVGTFWVARAYEKSSTSLKVVPMAYSRQQPNEPARVEFGYLVAETSDRIVFASLPRSPDNELREFPRDEADDVETGRLTGPGPARALAARFAFNLCRRVNALPRTSAAKAKMRPAPPCAVSYIAQLAGIAKLTLPLQPRVACKTQPTRTVCTVHLPDAERGTMTLSLARGGESLTLGPGPITGKTVTLRTKFKLPLGKWRAIVALTTASQRQSRGSTTVRMR
jgi:hypothetical protein